MTEHTFKRFDAELEDIRSRVLAMGGLVEQQITSAMAGLASGDLQALDAVIKNDERVNRHEVELDEACVQVIAKRQPTAIDLRMVMMVIKTITDLERIGDEAKKIAKGVRRIYEGGHMPSQYGVGIRHLAEAALSMIRQALDAFARLDTELAKSVIRADTDVDTEFKSIIRQLITHMMEDPRTITTSIDIITIARAIERIGDHAKNVSEQVIYVVDGRDIRHMGKEAAQ